MAALYSAKICPIWQWQRIFQYYILNLDADPNNRQNLTAFWAWVKTSLGLLTFPENATQIHL